MGMLFKWLSHSVLLEVTHPHPFLPSSLWVPSGAGNDTLSLPSSNFGEDALHFPQKNPVVWWKIEVSVWVRTPIKSKRRLSTFSTQPITRMGGLGPKLYRLWNTSSTGYQGSKDSSLDKVFFSAHCRVWATLGISRDPLSTRSLISATKRATISCRKGHLEPMSDRLPEKIICRATCLCEVLSKFKNWVV